LKSSQVKISWQKDFEKICIPCKKASRGDASLITHLIYAFVKAKTANGRSLRPSFFISKEFHSIIVLEG
jgi:hypothetical protein